MGRPARRHTPVHRWPARSRSRTRSTRRRRQSRRASRESPPRNSGIFNTPVGADGPGPLTPGSAYEFTFVARPGDRLSFATMYVQSNDLFLAPGDTGIALFTDDRQPISGDVTDQIGLWDAGTEVNEEPGVGANQAPRQAAANTGADEGGTVRLVDDGFAYPTIADIVRITITSSGG